MSTFLPFHLYVSYFTSVSQADIKLQFLWMGCMHVRGLMRTAVKQMSGSALLDLGGKGCS